MADALPAMRAASAHEVVRAAWRDRRKHARRAARSGADGDDPAAARAAELDRPCVLADYPPSVLGVVSDRFEDALEAFLTARGGEGAARKEAFRDAMHLRCAHGLKHGAGVLAVLLAHAHELASLANGGTSSA